MPFLSDMANLRGGRPARQLARCVALLHEWGPRRRFRSVSRRGGAVDRPDPPHVRSEQESEQEIVDRTAKECNREPIWFQRRSPGGTSMPAQTNGPAVRWSRRTLAVAAATMLLAASVLPAGAQDPPAPDEQAPTDPVPASTGDDTLVSGGDAFAMAEGQILTVAPFAGGLALPVKIGTSGSRVEGSTATATSATLDLGLLGDLALLAVSTAPTLKRLGIDTSGAPAYVPLPRPVTADSRYTTEVDNRVALDAVSLGPVTVGAGHETARAREGGPASSRTELGDLGIDLGIGDLLLAGGVIETEASAGEVTGTVAFGQMRLQVQGTPVVDLRGLEWRVHQVLGEAPTGEFALGSATVMGTRYASPGLEALEAAASAINTVLAPAGVTLQLPAVTEDGVSPLQLMLKDSPAAFEYLNPVYSLALSGAVNAIEEALVGGVPETGLAVTVVNVLLAAATGRGGARVDIGGLNAFVGTTPIESFSYGSAAAPLGASPPPVPPASRTVPGPGTTDQPSRPARAPVPASPTPTGATDEQPGTLAGSARSAPRTIASVVGEDLPGAAVLALGGLAVLAAWLFDRRRISDWAAGR